MGEQQSDLIRALREAERAFEDIRRTLIAHLREPESSAFWRAVSARDAVRTAIAKAEGGAS